MPSSNLQSPIANLQWLIIFARQPAAGRTKTRLCPPLDGATAAALYECFLRDGLDVARQVRGAQPVIAYTPGASSAYFAQLAPDLPAFAQRGAGLGERMHNAFDHLRLGDDKNQEPRTENQRVALVAGSQFSVLGSAAVLIGSDFPHLPAAYVQQAFDELEAGADAVFGPSDDGGYYLVGLRAVQPRLFEVPMSTPTVLRDTLSIAAALGLRVALLPRWYDVDTAADLRRLVGDLRAAPPEVAPHTRAFLAATGTRVLPPEGEALP